MKQGRLFKVIGGGGRIVGGFVLFALADGTVRVGRAFLEPEVQNRGIGGELLAFAESAIPDTKRLLLDTPVWNLRNQHFYEKAGYSKTDEVGSDDGIRLVQYEKRI
jgi:GNAT superfamily N-acetyltransferase